MRKRRAVRPRLESMEDRIVLSAMAAHLPAAEVRAVRASEREARAAQAHAARHPAATRHHHAIAPAPAHPKAKAHAKSKASSTNILSEFFKSAFGGL